MSVSISYRILHEMSFDTNFYEMSLDNVIKQATDEIYKHFPERVSYTCLSSQVNIIEGLDVYMGGLA